MQNNQDKDLLIDLNRSQSGSLAELKINVEQKLNAINPIVCQEMISCLRQWQVETSPIKAVVIEGSGKKAFSAGGDIQHVYRGLDSGKIRDTIDFFRLEYTNNWQIHNFPKPYIAIADGITMGGGVGVSFIGNMPVVTENTIFAMPETAIGYVPDVGMASYLAKLGAMGLFIGLTGAKLNARDLLELGLAKFAIKSDEADSFKADLAIAIDKLKDNEDVFKTAEAVLNAQPQPDLEPSVVLEHQESITKCFSANNFGEVITNLKSDNSAWAREVLEILRSKSPTALAVAFQHIAGFTDNSFNSALQRDFCIMFAAFSQGDFKEGIRAMVIDKDKNPKWGEFDYMNYSPSELEHWFVIPNNETPLELKWKTDQTQ